MRLGSSRTELDIELRAQHNDLGKHDLAGRAAFTRRAAPDRD
jgi:hypothetical protein